MQRPASAVVVAQESCAPAHVPPPCLPEEPGQSIQDEPRRHSPAIRLAEKRPCPHCGSNRVQGHGSFVRKDGTRQQRLLCRACGRTFNEHTGTPLHYLKKRHLWERLAQGMAEKLSVRGTAATLKIQVATAFRWRHRLLSALCSQAQPVLSGRVAAGEAMVPYSEKGSRKTRGPGAHGRRCRPGAASGRPFRRFADGKAACVLLACAGEQHVVTIAGRAGLAPAELHACLARVLGAGAELWAWGLAPFAEACRRLGVRYLKTAIQGAPGWSPTPGRGVDKLRGQLYGWLRRFNGVATRYLRHYLVWYSFAVRTAGLQPPAAGQQLLVESHAPKLPESAASPATGPVR